eukprot:3941186-Rhodomonas_salina.2
MRYTRVDRYGFLHLTGDSYRISVVPGCAWYRRARPLSEQPSYTALYCSLKCTAQLLQRCHSRVGNKRYRSFERGSREGGTSVRRRLRACTTPGTGRPSPR